MEFSHHFFGMHYAWWIFWIVVICALFVICALLMWGKTSRRETPRETLRHLYAAGEITEEKYKHQLSVLEQTDNRKHRKTNDRSTESRA